ncbi:hypothetical protein [Streptomonospora alba]|uniref:hypothetical protein n=1 Tax=Streptomonospora alba TaxID=183763 RepID=UPI0012ED1766|nr:hypothetical protein [Streptomonospora alba]
MNQKNESPGPLARHQVYASPDYSMISIHGGSGYLYGSNAVIRRSTREGAAADEHWIVARCANDTVKVRFDIAVWWQQPPGADTDEAEQEHMLAVGFPEQVLYIDQGTKGMAAEISLPRAGAYAVRLRGWNHHVVMHEAEDIEQRADAEDWDLDRMGEELDKLDGKERYAVDLWPTHGTRAPAPVGEASTSTGGQRHGDAVPALGRALGPRRRLRETPLVPCPAPALADTADGREDQLGALGLGLNASPCGSPSTWMPPGAASRRGRPT